MWIRRLWLRLQSLFHRDRSAQQLDDEIQFHLEQQIAENLAAGMSRDEARCAAMRTFGNPTFQGRNTGHPGLDMARAHGSESASEHAGTLPHAGICLTAVVIIAIGIGTMNSGPPSFWGLNTARSGTQMSAGGRD